MKRSISFFLRISFVFLWVAGCTPAVTAEPKPAPTPTLSTQDIVSRLHFFGTAAFLYHGSRIIYFDPVTLDGNLPKADLILVTHGHSDHWSVPDIQKIVGPNTTLIISPNVSNAYEASKAEIGAPATILGEGKTMEVAGVKIEAVPAYDTSFHQRESGGVGFILTVDGIRLYHAGGTAAYPEMAQYTCDVALIPAYSRALTQALGEIVPAKVTIIMHTSYYGAKALSDLFKQDIGGGKTFVALQDGPYTP